jgi:hypothetical protein
VAGVPYRGRVRSRRPALMLLLLALLPAGCTGTTPSPTVASAGVYPGWTDRAVGADPIVPILVSSELAVGPNRFLFSLADAENRIIASPEVGVALRFFDLAASTERPAIEREGLFLAVDGVERGLYRAKVDFPRAGDWGVQVEANGPGVPELTARVMFSVAEKSATPAIGATAPASETPTARDRSGIAAISTDEDPDPDFYRSSVREAVSSGRPSVITFATPKFCTSRVCGPTLDVVKAVAPPFKEWVTFVHVEVFSNLEQPDQLEVVPAVGEWSLPTEPWVFVVDAEGKVAAKFEGVVAPEELEAAIKDVLRG